MEPEKREEKLKALGIDIRSVLICSAAKGGRSVDEVNRDYKEMNVRPIPFRELGFPSLEALFMELRDRNVCNVMQGRIYAVATQETAHTLRLVQGQKKPAKKGARGKKGKGTRGMGTSGIAKAYGFHTPARLPTSSTASRPRPLGAVRPPSFAASSAFGSRPSAFGPTQGSFASANRPAPTPAHLRNNLPSSSAKPSAFSKSPAKPSAFGARIPLVGMLHPLHMVTTRIGRHSTYATLNIWRPYGVGGTSPLVPSTVASSTFKAGSSISFGAEAKSTSLANFGSAASAPVPRPSVSSAGIRSANYHLGAAANERSAATKAPTTPPPEPRTTTPTPGFVVPGQKAPPSPTPSLPPQRSVRPAPTTQPRYRWTKGRVDHKDDWSKEWSVKGPDSGKRSGRQWAEVGLAQYEDLASLFLIRKSAFGELRKLEKDLAATFADRNKAPMGMGAMEFWLPMLQRDLKPGLHVAVHVKEPTDLGYNRAEVLAVVGKSVELQCLDYGTKVTVAADRVHHLPAHLAVTPRLARPFRCHGWDAAVFEVPDEDKLEDFILRFCDVEDLASVRLVADLVEKDGGRPAVNLFREDTETGEWLELADELMKIGYVRPRKAPQDAGDSANSELTDRLAHASLN